MLDWIIRFSLRHRLLVCLLSAVLVGIGVVALNRLPIDAFPDTTPVQVQINTVVPSLNPLEIEQQITQFVELSIGGLPGLQNVRSISKFGFSQVVATFDDAVSIYLARQLVSERLAGVELPEGIKRPQLGPIATGLGEVFHYLVSTDNPERTLTELRELHDWIVKPELRKVRGVAEVNSWGGFEKQFHVIVEPELLIKYGLTFHSVFEALEANNRNVGGGQIVASGEALLVHGLGLTTSVEQIGDIVVATHDGTPVRMRDVGHVQVGHEIRRGAVTADGEGEAVLGLGFMLMGENSHVVTRELKKQLAKAQQALPDDVRLEILYERTDLIDKVIRTVEDNLLAGALLVIVVLFVFLGNLRAGLIVALAIPLSMLFAGSMMVQAGIAASLLSLGAVDFGLIVDSSVIMVENCVRRAALRTNKPWMDTIRDAAIEVRKPTMFGELIIMIVFLPILALEGVEGKLFRPMALTMIFALLGSLVLSLSLMPVLASFILPRKLKEKEPWLVRVAHRAYAPILDLALRFRTTTLVGATVLVVLAAGVASRTGGEFLPKLSEGTLVVNVIRLAGVHVNEAAASNTLLERLILEEFPDEVERAWSRLGTAEIATDPMGIELTDIFLTLRPRGEWKRARTQQGLAAEIERAMRDFPGINAVLTQPIEMRMNEMIAGIRSDIGIKIYGDDLETLRRLSDEVQEVLLDTPGASEISGEQITGLPMLQVAVDRDAIARYGIPARDVLTMVEAVGNLKAGEIREGQRRFPLAVRLPDAQRTDPDALAATLIPTASGPVVRMDQVARLEQTEGPSTIQREWSRRRITVQCNVRGRDVASFVAEAKDRIAEQVTLPEGYTVEWGGQFESMERANRRLKIIVPMALGLIFIMLYLSLGSVRDLLIVATGIPLGAVGGIGALALRGLPFTVSAAIGFIALSGVAILNGLVLVTFIQQRLAAEVPLEQAVREGCQVRLRPVLMTALVAAVGFIPMAINTGVGAEVQRPLATVVIGGIVSNTLLTLVVLPTLYTSFRRRQPTRIENVTGQKRRAMKRITQLSCIAAGALLSSSDGLAVEPPARYLTLDQARQEASARSPVLAAQKALLEQAEGRLFTARTYPHDPALILEGANREGAGESSTDRGIKATQVVEIGGQRRRRVAQASAELDAARARFQRESRLLAARVSATFVEALRARELLQVEQANTELVRSLAEVARQRFEAGSVPQMEVNLAQVQVGRAELDLRLVRSSYEVACAALAESIGLDPTAPPQPMGELDLPPREPVSLSELVDGALRHRGDLAAFRATIEAAQARIALVRREVVPDLAVEGFYGREEGDRLVGGKIGIRIPLFNRNRGPIAEARATERRAAADTEAVRLQVAREVVAARATHDALSEASSDLQQGVLGTLEENLLLLQLSFEAGKTGWTEVLVFRREFVDIQRDYIDTLADARLAGIALDLAAGVPASTSRP